jgi:hypothetical protein
MKINLKGGTIMKKKKIKNKYMLGIFALAVIAVLGVGIAVASPMEKGFGFVNNHNFTAAEKTALQTQMQEIQTAIDNKDFATWKSLMESQLTEDNFNKLVDANQKMTEVKTLQDELKQAVSDGDTAKAKELKAQIFDLMPQKNFERQQPSMNQPQTS